MPSTPPRQVVAAFVSEIVGGEVTTVEPLQGSIANHNFLVRLAGRPPVVVKAGPGAEMTAEAWACRLLGGVGLPVPPVLALDLDVGPDGLPALVLGLVPGTPSDDPAVLRQAGLVLRRVHAEQLPGWGRLVVEPNDPEHPARGCHSSWREAVLAKLEGLPELIDAGVIDTELGTAARSHVLVDQILDYQGPGVLSHNDLKPAHILATTASRAARLSAVIDWGDASVGDPLADLARLSMAGPPVAEAFLAGYGLSMTPARADRLARYRILWNVAALTYEFRAGGDWFQVYRQRVAADIRLLERRGVRAPG